MRLTGAVEFHPSSAVDFTAATAVDNSGGGNVEPCDCGVCCPERVDADGWPLTPAGERERPVTVRTAATALSIALLTRRSLSSPQRPSAAVPVKPCRCPQLLPSQHCPTCLPAREGPSEACVACAVQETPLVRRHPVTKELAVHGSVQGFWRFVGRGEEESRDIMQVRHHTSPVFVSLFHEGAATLLCANEVEKL